MSEGWFVTFDSGCENGTLQGPSTRYNRNLVPRAFSSTIFKMASRRSAILKIVEEKALGTRLATGAVT